MHENGSMKTSELAGAQLDYWVAKAEGLVVPRPGWASCVSDGVRIDAQFSPSSSWHDGGPIIERERISVYQSDAGDWSGLPRGWLSDPDRKNPYVRGPTLLIAAMRAYVASKYGDEVPTP